MKKKEERINNVTPENRWRKIAGAAHVHPTLARTTDRLYYAWSRQSDDHTPQVVIEVFEVSDTDD